MTAQNLLQEEFPQLLAQSVYRGGVLTHLSAFGRTWLMGKKKSYEPIEGRLVRLNSAPIEES
jgi:hypothetical protein